MQYPKIDELRVLIVAEDPLIRESLASRLASHGGLTIVGQHAIDRNLFSKLESEALDVVLWDCGWDSERALEQLADIPDASPPIVALLPDDTRLAEAWGENVKGFLLRTTETEELLAALRAAARGLLVLDPQFASLVFRPRPAQDNPLREDLTPREREVLQLLAEGLANKAIAHRLNLSEHTVKFHLNTLMGKLGAQSRTEAVVRATRLGLIIL